MTRRWTLGVAAVVMLVTAIAFQNASPNVFIHDDKFFAPQDLKLDWPAIKRFFGEDAWAATGAPTGVYRPLLIFTLSLERQLKGAEAAGFHHTNVLLHVAATLLLFGLLLTLLRRRRLRGVTIGEAAAAAAAAIWFGVHPIHTEAVDSVFNRTEMIVSLAVVGAIWIVWRLPRRGLLAWGLVALIYSAAILFRESAATLPALILVVVGLVDDYDGFRDLVRRFLPGALLLVPLVIYFLLRRHALGPVATAGMASGMPWGQRLGFSVATILESVRMVVWPYPLRATYADLAPAGVPGAVVMATLVGAAAAAWRRVPGLAVAVGFFLLALLPSTRIFTDPRISVVAAERYVYLPSVGVAIGLAIGLGWLARRLGPWPVAAAAAMFAVIFVPITRTRNLEWHNAVALFEADLRAAPGNIDAMRLLTSAYLDASRPADAARVCDANRSRQSEMAQFTTHCAIAYDRLNRMSDAEAAYREVVRLGLGAIGHANLGRFLARTGRPAEAESEFEAAVDAEGDPARKHFRRGDMILRFHPERRAEARAEFEAALAIQPRFLPARQALDSMGPP